MADPNFIEVFTCEEACQVSLEAYVFMDNVSAARKSFVFKIRQAKRK